MTPNVDVIALYKSLQRAEQAASDARMEGAGPDFGARCRALIGQAKVQLDNALDSLGAIEVRLEKTGNPECKR